MLHSYEYIQYLSIVLIGTVVCIKSEMESFKSFIYADCYIGTQQMTKDWCNPYEVGGSDCSENAAFLLRQTLLTLMLVAFDIHTFLLFWEMDTVLVSLAFLYQITI